MWSSLLSETLQLLTLLLLIVQELIFEKRISVNQALAQVAPPFLEMMNLQGTRKAASVSIQSHDEIYANLTPHERRICGTRTLFLSELALSSPSLISKPSSSLLFLF